LRALDWPDINFDGGLIYIREAEALGPDVGEPFPPLPLLAPPDRIRGGRRQVGDFSEESWRGGRDSNPRPPA
jgi:hypothetical protein